MMTTSSSNTARFGTAAPSLNLGVIGNCAISALIDSQGDIV